MDVNKQQELVRKAIAYSTDALIPGFYLWLGNWSFRIGGSEAEDSYPGVIHSSIGMWIHPSYRRVEAIYTADKSLVVTAYHVN